MQRTFSLIILFTLLFFQLGQSALMGVAAKVEENDFEIKIESASKTEVIIGALSLNKALDSIEILLPQDATFNDELTNELTHDVSEVIYDENNHRVILQWKEDAEDLNANIVLTELTQGQHKISARGNIDGEMTETKELIFNIPSEQLETNLTDQSERVDEDANVEKKIYEELEELEPKEDQIEEINHDSQKEFIITPFAGNLNVDLDISPHRATVISGNEAGYNLILKVTGSMTQYTNANVVIDLPITDYTAFTQDVSELVIDGVTPVYDDVNHTLTYEFGSLNSGRTYETLIKVDTENGVSPNGENLTAIATFEAIEQEPITDSATVSIDASGAINSSKQFLEVTNSERNLPYPNSNTLWEIKIDIPKKDTGQLYMKEGSQVVLTDTLPSGLTYVSTQVGPEPTQAGNELTWTFDAPSIEEQTNAEDELFSTTIQVLLRVAPGTVDTTQSNTVGAEAVFINDVTGTTSASHAITIVDSDTANGDITGSWYVPNHFGPSGDSSGVGNNQDRNPNPVVYDDATLQFNHGIAPLRESQHGDFRAYTTSYTIDSNLIFKELRTPGGFVYRPNSTYPNNIPLPNEPVFNIKAMVNGVEMLLVEDADTNRVYTRSDLGLEKTDNVSVIYYDFTYAPAGMLNVGTPQYYFEVVPGYVGEVRNVFDVYGVNGAGQSFSNEYNSDPLAGPRTAQIATRPDPQPPIATVQVELLDHENGEVITGDNRMRVQLNNTNSSTDPMEGQIETVVLLPLGVSLNENPNPTYIDANETTDQGGGYEVLYENYNGSGRQLVKVTWNDDRLRIGKNVAAELDVTISDNAPNTLQFDVYGFSGDEELRVPGTTGDTLTDTILQTDEEDLNADGITNQPRLKSGNEYFTRGDYNIETEKLVRGELDDDYSLFGHTTPNGSIDYQLKLTNTGIDISTMTLIDVLPSIGDLGITDNIERGSQFTPTLTGEVVLPAEWLNRVNVYYSTAKNPERDDLIRNVKYPESTEQLTNPTGAENPNWMAASEVTDWSGIHSFKIELQDSATWITGEDITIEFSMLAPSETDVARDVLDESIDPTSRAAWNSFALATDHGQPVEPLRVGVYMDYNIEDPVVEKTVNNQNETVELENRDERFTWEVAYDFGNYTADWTSVVLSDQIHELLDIESVQVLDQNDEDVTVNGDLVITEDNLVTFTLNLQNDSFAYLKDQTYTLIIESFIKEDATDEDLEPFIQSSGIPNQAELIIDDNPQSSNEVNVKPPVRGEIQILKVDQDTGVVLEGAAFELRKCEDDSSSLEDCEVVRTGTTTVDGDLTFNDLELGYYKLVETQAPEGYRILTTPLDIELTAENRFIELEVENERSGYMLPDTGGIGTIVFYVVGGLLMLGPLIYLVRKQKTSKR